MSDHHCPNSTTPITPGAYLRKRRAAAGVTLPQIATCLAALHHGPSGPGGPPRAASFLQRLSMRRRLAAAEHDRQHFTLCEVELLALLVPLDPRVYEQLVDLDLAGPDSGMPVPRLCRSCGCSFLDSCVDDFGITCTWARFDPNRCTSCVVWPAASHPRPSGPQELAA